MLSQLNYFFQKLLLFLATGLLAIVLWLINWLPFRIKIELGKSVGRLLYRIPSSRTHITRVNLKICFPELAAAEREKMVKEVFVNFGAGIVENAMGWWTNPEKLREITEFEDRIHLDNAIAKDRGVILLGAHFSTIDLSATLMGNFYECYALYRLQSNWLLNRIMTNGRKSMMKGMIPHTSIREAARKIMKKEIVWYSPDQDMGIEKSVFAPFFNHPAATIVATSKLAKLTKAPVVMLVSYRKSDDSGYVLKFLPCPDKFPVEDEVENATMVNSLIEQGIRCSPSQYYWFHRRFKSQPDMEKSAIYR